jgi:hypothetical protein
MEPRIDPDTVLTVPDAALRRVGNRAGDRVWNQRIFGSQAALTT